MKHLEKIESAKLIGMGDDGIKNLESIYESIKNHMGIEKIAINQDVDKDFVRELLDGVDVLFLTYNSEDKRALQIVNAIGFMADERRVLSIGLDSAVKENKDDVNINREFKINKDNLELVLNLLKDDNEQSFNIELSKENITCLSTYNEELIFSGNVYEAAKMLGRRYSIRGEVVHGNKLGTINGFPTANVDYGKYLLPKKGVYLVTVLIDGVEYLGMCNIGNNPTFNYSEIERMEVNIFNFKEKIYGKHIEVGKNFYANYNCTILDIAKVKIGDNCMLAPNVAIYTAGHPIHPVPRNLLLEYGKEIIIGDNVWIGGNTVVCPGVKIGSNVVIGAGSVVTKDIPDWSIAAGNPCRVIRKITDNDKNKLFKK